MRRPYTDAFVLVLCSTGRAMVCQRRSAALQIGNYDVLGRLGAGGMGTVFKARHRRMRRVVALKVLSSNLAKDESFVTWRKYKTRV